MRNRIVVGVGEALEAELLGTLQCYAVTPRARRPSELLRRIEPGRTAAVVLAEGIGSSLAVLLPVVRARHPLLPLLCVAGTPSTALLRLLAEHDAECLVAPVELPAVHRFAQRALSFGSLPDEAVAAWVGRLAVARALAPRETQLLCMALANEPRSRMRRLLGVSENTLKTHVRTLLRKTGERSLDGLAKNVLRVALLEARPGTRDIYRAPWLAA